MKNLLLALCSFIFTTALIAQTDGGRKIPAVEVKKLDGTNFNTKEISNNGKPIIISFWATWCTPCKKELNTIHDIYDDWKAETGVKLVAVSIDDARNIQKVAPYVNGRNWEYEIYLDPNQDFKRAMNVNNIPHTFLLNGNGEVVYQHNSYAEGDEIKLYELVKKVAKGEPISEK
jgi:thiol-disulfide isomerase/thioredoxin